MKWRIQPRAMDRVPTSQIWGVVLLVTLGIGLSWWTWIGPWPWATRLQLWAFDGWYPSGNLVLLYAVSLPCLLVPLALAHRNSPLQPRRDNSWWTHGPGRWLALAVLLLGIAVFNLAQGMLAGDVAEVPIDGLRDGRQMYVRVPTEGLTMRYATGVDDDWYVPVIADGEVRVALTCRSLGGPPAFEDYVAGEGMRSTFGLPSPVLSHWQAAGLGVGPRVPVVAVDADPTQRVFIGACVGFMSLPLFVMVAVGRLREARPGIG